MSMMPETGIFCRDKQIDASDIGNLELKLGEFHKCKELSQSYRAKYLKSQAATLKSIDVSHVKVVLELKKVLQIIHDINAF